MKQRKIPMRMCVITHEKCEKKNLIRIVKTESRIIVDPTGKVNGRGYYLKKDLAVIEKAKNSKILDKLFECEVADAIYTDAAKECL